MSDRLLEAFAYRAAALDRTMGQARWGVITSVDPSGPAVRLRLQPEDVLTGWMPVLQQAAGGGWSVTTIPVPGMQACVIFDNGDALNGIVIGFAHNDGARPVSMPAIAGTGGVVNTTDTPLQAGETVLTGPGGQAIRLGPAGIYMRGQVTIDGSLRVNGDVSDKVGSLDRLRTRYNGHTHTGTGSGPVPTDV